jgi:hypothetical protein
LSGLSFRDVVKQFPGITAVDHVSIEIKEVDKPLVVHLTRGAGREVKLYENQDVIVSWESLRNNVLRK